MEQKLEHSMQLLLEQMARQEARNAQLQKRFHWLSIAFALTLVLLVGMTFQVQMVHDARANNDVEQSSQISEQQLLSKLDIDSLNVLLKTGAMLVQQQQKTGDPKDNPMAGIIGDVIKIIKNLEEITTALATEENGEALKKLADAINSTGISDAINALGKDMHSMSWNMYLMTSDMRRMSSTATPAMGKMYDMMRVIPTP